MTTYGYTLSSEEHPPSTLVDLAARAEAVGFDFLTVSDHFHPWVQAQGHSPFVWSLLGAVSAVTDRVRVGVGVSCPIMRIHPAIVAQAAATSSLLLEGRFFLGVGTGEALNEHIVGRHWPVPEVRRTMLAESIEVMRRLWTGETVDHHGEHFTVENARLFDPPDEQIPVVVSAFATDAASELAPVAVPQRKGEPVAFAADECVRADASLPAMARLKPSFRKENGTVTAGNASPLNDGSSAVLLGSEAAASIIGRDPIARVAGRGVSATEPQWFGFAPVEAADRALARAGISWGDVGAVELNEAFAVQSLACVDAWAQQGLDPQLVNAKGGAIAIGHPLGASGGRVVGTLAARLRESGERWGVAAICIGVGQALAVVLENVDGTP